MKTSFDVCADIYSVLAESGFKSSISGNIYKEQRPDNSDLEDILIEAEVNEISDMAKATVTLSLFVPNKHINIKATPQFQPDTKRMKVLTDLINGLFKEYYSTSPWHTFIVGQNIDKNESHHITKYTLEYYSYS